MEGQEANLFCKVASTIRGVQDLIVEHWEVECQPKPDGVGWSQISKSNILQTKNQQQWISINKICSQPINICTKIKPEQLCKHSWYSPQHPSSPHLTWTQQGTYKIIMRNQIPRYPYSRGVKKINRSQIRILEFSTIRDSTSSCIIDKFIDRKLSMHHK